MTTMVQTMTEEHVEALLALLVSLDPRLRAPDAATAQIRASAWTTLLGEVDPGFAVKYAELAYQEVRELAISPAEILGAWRESQRAEAETVGAALFDAGGYVDQQSGWDPVMVDFLRDVLAAYQRGEDPESVPRPQTTRRPPTAAQEAWSRRCAFHRICACDHTTCRDGWADAEGASVGLNGVAYPAVRRCVHCADALAMAVERGIAKNPSARNAGRRR